MVQQLSLSQVRVIDPILTEYQHGYLSQQDLLVWNKILPSVPVQQSGGKVLEFGKEAFRLYDTRRAPGGEIKRVEFGYEGSPYVLYQDAMDALVPVEFQRDALEVPKLDLSKEAVYFTTEAMSTRVEYDAAKVCQDNVSYAPGHIAFLAGTAKFSHADSDPIATVDIAREVIRSKIGRYPNFALAGPQAHNAIKNNPKLNARFTNKDSEPALLTTVQIAQAFGVDEYAVGLASYADDADNFQNIWGNNLILAYVPRVMSGAPKLEGQTLDRPTTLSRRRPAFGYTYNMEGHPRVYEPYYDRRVDSWVYGCKWERQPLITSMYAGYIIRNVA